MMNGLTIDTLIVERAVSGSIPVSERAEGQTMMASLKRGDTIVATKLDRLFRSALDALQTVEVLKEQGVSLVLLDLGGDVVMNGMSKMFLTITAAFAEAERDRIADRIRGAKADAKARGRYLGGIVPFGFTKTDKGDLIEVPEEQAILATVRQAKAEKQPLRTIQAKVQADHGRKISLGWLSKVGA